jgi:hypothetical protein
VDVAAQESSWSDEFPARLPATKYAIQSTHHRVVSRSRTRWPTAAALEVICQLSSTICFGNHRKTIGAHHPSQAQTADRRI